MKRLATVATALALTFGLSACGDPLSTEAETVRQNQDKAAEQFEVNRRITFLNGITDSVLLTAEGRCSYTIEGYQVVVQCKTGDRQYVKHAMVRSDNVTVVVEQIAPNEVDPYHHRIVLRPEALVPDLDLETSADIEGDG